MKVEAMYIGPNGNYKLVTGHSYRVKLWVHKGSIYVKRDKKTIIGYEQPEDTEEVEEVEENLSTV